MTDRLIAILHDHSQEHYAIEDDGDVIIVLIDVIDSTGAARVESVECRCLADIRNVLGY